MLSVGLGVRHVEDTRAGPGKWKETRKNPEMRPWDWRPLLER